MNRRRNTQIGILAGKVFCLLASTGLLSSGGWSQSFLSPLSVTIGPDPGIVFVVEFDADRVEKVDLASGQVAQTYPVGYPPTGAVISPEGSRLYVTDSPPSGSVWVFDTETGSPLSRIEAGHSPVAPILSPDAKTLFVCNRFENEVLLIDLETEKIRSTVAVDREPVAAAVTPDGRFLVVANHLPAGRADTGLTAARVCLIDTGTAENLASISLPNGSTSLRGVCVSPDGRYAYVTHILARYLLPTTQLDRGWMNTNAVSVIDIEKRSLVNTFLLDNIDLGAANPWGIACSPDGKTLVVSHSGTHELSLIDREQLHRKLDEAENPKQVPNDLAFLVGLRRRIPLEGRGPRGIAVTGDCAVVAEFFSDSLSVVPLERAQGDRPRSIPLGDSRKMTGVRRGEFLFHDASICFQQWQSCATCHPDARTDGLNWDLLNDGLGNPKNTKNMLLAHRTPPTTITGIRKDAETSVRAGFRYIEYTLLPEEDLSAVDEYLKSLEATPSPYLEEGELGEAARRGEAVFKKARCVRCHPAPLYTDLGQYDVGTGIGNEEGQLFDTPTLIESWRTAPYLYDGRAVTLKQAIEAHEQDVPLSEQELNDLVAFVRSL